MRALILAVSLLASLASRADDYIEPRADETSRTDMARGETFMSVAVQGPVYPAKDFDPPCQERLYSNCRKVCADLPPGKKFASIVSESIQPPEYTRFVDVAEGAPVEIEQAGDHQRVCRRMKVWRPMMWVEVSVTVAWK